MPSLLSWTNHVHRQQFVPTGLLPLLWEESRPMMLPRVNGALGIVLRLAKAWVTGPGEIPAIKDSVVKVDAKIDAALEKLDTRLATHEIREDRRYAESVEWRVKMASDVGEIKGALGVKSKDIPPQGSP